MDARQLNADGAPTHGLLRLISPSTRGLLETLNRTKRPLFGIPGLFVTPEAAAVAQALAEWLHRNGHGDERQDYCSFFASSRYEAAQGAIKLVRHFRHSSYHRHGGRVLVLDPRGDLRSLLDPTEAGPEHALAPGLVFLSTLAELCSQLDAPAGACALLLWALEPGALKEAWNGLARRDLGGAPVIVDLSTVDPRGPVELELRQIDRHVVVFGESLTACEIPFGAFTAPASIFAPWRSEAGAFLHTTTYGGNTVALAKVLETLSPQAGNTAPADLDPTDVMSWRSVLDRYARYVNPQAAHLHRMLAGFLHLVRADGGRVTVQLDSGRRVQLVDALSGGGLGVSGHNPDDVRSQVLDAHSASVDYGAELERLLAAETGLDHAFPAVSGATAVDNALTLAALARPSHPQIVSFKGNYAGKTLPSLSLTSDPAVRAPFGPLNPRVRFVDPFHAGAYDELRAALRSGNTGLVWLEIVHGSAGSYQPIPDPLLELIAEERKRQQFLVGVDEVLTSYYRCGRRFAHRGRLPEVDILTVSKTLSYLTFPVAFTLASNAVVDAARRAAADEVQRMKTRYANQLGAHLAIHAIRKVDVQGIGSAAAAADQLLRQALSAAPRRSVGRYLVEGGFVRIEPRAPWPLQRSRVGRALFATLLTVWWAEKTGTFVLSDCLGPPLCGGAADANHVAAAIRRLGATPPWRVMAFALACLARERCKTFAGRLTGWLRRPIAPTTSPPEEAHAETRAAAD